VRLYPTPDLGSKPDAEEKDIILHVAAAGGSARADRRLRPAASARADCRI
jgi:hypothetical protein